MLHCYEEKNNDFDGEGKQGMDLGTFSFILLLRVGSQLLPATWLSSLLRIIFAPQQDCKQSKSKFVCPFFKMVCDQYTWTFNRQATYTHEQICK